MLGQAATDDRPAAATPKPAKKKAAPIPDDILARDRAFTPMEDGLGGALSSMVKPVIRRGTRLIDLYVTNRDPAMAQRLAEAVGREYIRMSIERRSNFSQESLRYLMEEEERLKLNLQKSEAAVAEYKAKTPDALQLGGGAAATGSQAGAGGGGGRGGLVEDKLQELSSKVTSAKADRVRLESELKQIDQLDGNVESLLSIPSIAAAPVVVDRRRDVAQLESAVASLAQRYKSKHPKMMAARAALTEAQEALKRAVLAQPAVLRNVLAQARAAETQSRLRRLRAGAGRPRAEQSRHRLPGTGPPGRNRSRPLRKRPPPDQGNQSHQGRQNQRRQHRRARHPSLRPGQSESRQSDHPRPPRRIGRRSRLCLRRRHSRPFPQDRRPGRVSPRSAGPLRRSRDRPGKERPATPIAPDHPSRA